MFIYRLCLFICIWCSSQIDKCWQLFRNINFKLITLLYLPICYQHFSFNINRKKGDAGARECVRDYIVDVICWFWEESAVYKVGDGLRGISTIMNDVYCVIYIKRIGNIKKRNDNPPKSTCGCIKFMCLMLLYSAIIV